jgi:nucleotide-binding universal stress UspA family protein
MYKNILIPVALDHGSDVSDKIQVARRLLSEGGNITLLSVVEQVPGYVVEYVTVKRESKILNEVGARLEAITEGQPDLIHAVVSGNPGVEITNFAEKNRAELIIVGSHRPGLQEYFLGSTASRVVRRAPCAVLVVR